MSDKIFAEGIYYDLPHPKAPKFVRGQIAIVVDKFIPFLQKYKKGDYVRLDIKESQKNKLYIELSTWEPGKKVEKDKASEEERNQEILNNLDNDINPDDIPF